MPVNNNPRQDLVRYQEVEGLIQGLHGSRDAVISAQERDRQVENEHLDTFLRDGSLEYRNSQQNINEGMQLSQRRAEMSRRALGQTYLAGSTRLETATNDFLRRMLASNTVEEAEEASAKNEIFISGLSRIQTAQYDNLSEAQRLQAEDDRRLWDDLDSKISLSAQASERHLEGIKEVLEIKGNATERHLKQWMSVVERAIAAKEKLEHIHLSLRAQSEKEAEGKHLRELAEKEQILSEYLQKTELRMKETAALREHERAGVQQRNAHQLATDQRRDEAALKELEAYVKHKLTGKGKYYHLTKRS